MCKSKMKSIAFSFGIALVGVCSALAAVGVPPDTTVACPEPGLNSDVAGGGDTIAYPKGGDYLTQGRTVSDGGLVFADCEDVVFVSRARYVAGAYAYHVTAARFLVNNVDQVLDLIPDGLDNFVLSIPGTCDSGAGSGTTLNFNPVLITSPSPAVGTTITNKYRIEFDAEILSGAAGSGDAGVTRTLRFQTCDDGNACTIDTCTPGVGCSYVPRVCNDGNACTTDNCNPATGCTTTPIVCNDGNACTNDSCDPATGCTTTPVVCNDGNACTNDSCNPDTGCTTTPVVCNDGNACTNDSCNPSTGCTTTPVVCNDGNACTNDSCDPATGCTTTPVVCNDGNACTNDSCDPATGCTTTPVVCNDGNACTNDSCDPASGCTTTPVVCNDGNACTNDSCDPASGCTTTPVVCNDGNDCTTDSCDPQSGCTTAPIPGCGEFNGCTPGFWKNCTASWPAPIQGTLLGSIFNIPACVENNGKKSKPLATTTLLQALGLQGGASLNEAAQTLLRAGAAAYINSLNSMNYEFSTAEVVSAVNAALATCDKAGIIAVAGDLDRANNAGCRKDLDGNGSVESIPCRR